MATNNPVMNAKNFYGKRTLENSDSKSCNFSSFENCEDEYQIVPNDFTSSDDFETFGESNDNEVMLLPQLELVPKQVLLLQ